MFRFFGAVGKKWRSESAFGRALVLSKQGDKLGALKICEKLVEQYPYEVQFRHRLTLLQKELNQEIDLPSISKGMDQGCERK